MDSLSLPVEIGIYISEYLTPLDVYTLRLVSRRWNEYWGNQSISTSLLKQNYRVNYEKRNPREDCKITVNRLLSQQCQAQYGGYCSMAIYPYHEHDFINGDEVFSNHIIVAESHGTWIPPSRSLRYKQALPMSILRPTMVKISLLAPRQLPHHTANTLHVFDLDSHTKSVVNIPSGANLVTSSEGRIAVAGRRFVLTWTKDVGVQKVFHQPIPLNQGFHAVFFHPSIQDMTIVISTQVVHSAKLKHPVTMNILVQEYSNKLLGHSASLALPYLNSRHEHRIEFDVRPIDNNGTYSIGWIFENTYLEGIDHACSTYVDDGVYHHLICYNVYSKELFLRCFSTGYDRKQLAPAEDCESSYVWADQMITPVHDVKSDYRHYFYQSIIASEADPSALVIPRIYDGTGTTAKATKNDILLDQSSVRGLFSYFMYTTSKLPGQESLGQDSFGWRGRRKIRGGERFMVLLGEMGYVVWCFDEHFKLPAIPQMSNQYLAYQQSRE